MKTLKFLGLTLTTLISIASEASLVGSSWIGMPKFLWNKGSEKIMICSPEKNDHPQTLATTSNPTFIEIKSDGPSYSGYFKISIKDFCVNPMEIIALDYKLQQIGSEIYERESGRKVGNISGDKIEIDDRDIFITDPKEIAKLLSRTFWVHKLTIEKHADGSMVYYLKYEYSSKGRLHLEQWGDFQSN